MWVNVSLECNPRWGVPGDSEANVVQKCEWILFYQHNIVNIIVRLSFAIKEILSITLMLYLSGLSCYIYCVK